MEIHLLLTYPNLTAYGYLKLTSVSVKVVWMVFPIEKVSESVVTVCGYMKTERWNT